MSRNPFLRGISSTRESIPPKESIPRKEHSRPMNSLWGHVLGIGFNVDHIPLNWGRIYRFCTAIDLIPPSPPNFQLNPLDSKLTTKRPLLQWYNNTAIRQLLQWHNNTAIRQLLHWYNNTAIRQLLLWYNNTAIRQLLQWYNNTAIRPLLQWYNNTAIRLFATLGYLTG